jgi:hypothetical protein
MDDIDAAQLMIGLHSDQQSNFTQNQSSTQNPFVAKISASKKSYPENPLLIPNPFLVPRSGQPQNYFIGEESVPFLTRDPYRDRDAERDSVSLMEDRKDDSNAWVKKTESLKRQRQEESEEGYDNETDSHVRTEDQETNVRKYDPDRGLDGLADDDTLLILDRMRDLTSRTLHLEVYTLYIFVSLSLSPSFSLIFSLSLSLSLSLPFSLPLSLSRVRISVRVRF